ncbi:MAG: hypothetical protein AB7O66_04425 [Limisphaerales bacterium]
MDRSNTLQFLSHDPGARIVSRFEKAFALGLHRDGLEPYPALVQAWDEALEFHRTIEHESFETPATRRVRDTICRLFSLMPNPERAGRHAARVASAFASPASRGSQPSIQALSYLSLLCHAAIREPARCDLLFGEANPRARSADWQRGRQSFQHADISRLLNLLAPSSRASADRAGNFGDSPTLPLSPVGATGL